MQPLVSVTLCSCLFLLVNGFFPVKPGVVYSAYHDGSKWAVREGPDGLASATFQNSLNQNGWTVLEAWTNKDKSIDDQALAYALGFIEGAVTSEQIWQAYFVYVNQTAELYPAPAPINQFVLDNYLWLRKQVQLEGASSPYWFSVGLVLTQMDGLFAGYNKHVAKMNQIKWLDLMMYVLNTEVGDLQNKFNLTQSASSNKAEHCSALIRLSADRQHLFLAHDTWSDYFSLLRVYKHYHARYHSELARFHSISLSGYPGFLQSVDDFLLTSAGLAITETTNNVFNMSLYSATTAQTVPYWVRSLLASFVASTGAEWTELFYRFNSGTYNNQWMVLDYKLFKSGQLPRPGALWVSEQLPGVFQSADMTEQLAKPGYWASYNINYFPLMYNLSGTREMYNQFGYPYSWSSCARANIFRRDAPQVQSLSDMKRIMRYNEWQTDPLALTDACRGISSRCDLNPPWSNNSLNSYGPFGGIDSKITSDKMIGGLQAEAVSGPTWDSQPVFAWTNQWAATPTLGMPEVWAFDFVTMQPQRLQRHDETSLN